MKKKKINTQFTYCQQIELKPQWTLYIICILENQSVENLPNYYITFSYNNIRAKYWRLWDCNFNCIYIVFYIVYIKSFSLLKFLLSLRNLFMLVEEENEGGVEGFILLNISRLFYIISMETFQTTKNIIWQYWNFPLLFPVFNYANALLISIWACPS